MSVFPSLVVGGPAPLPPPEPPPPPPSTKDLNELKNQFNDIQTKLNDGDVSDQDKMDLQKVWQDLTKAYAGEAGKPGGGDPAVMNELGDMLDSLRPALENMLNDQKMGQEGAG